MTPQLLSLWTTQLLLATSPAPPDPCALLSPAEIASALGSQPGPGTRHELRMDAETGARISDCDRKLGDGLLAISVAAFDRSASAAAALAEAARVTREEEDEMRLRPEPGIGDGALWGASAIGAILVVHHGTHLLTLTLAGELGDGGKYRDPLKRLAGIALGKL